MLKKWLGEHSFLAPLLNGPEAQRKLLTESEQALERARIKRCQALEQAGLQLAKFTHKAAELASEDDPSIDLEEIEREVDEELRKSDKIVLCLDDEDTSTDEAA